MSCFAFRGSFLSLQSSAPPPSRLAGFPLPKEMME